MKLRIAVYEIVGSNAIGAGLANRPVRQVLPNRQGTGIFQIEGCPRIVEPLVSDEHGQSPLIFRLRLRASFKGPQRGKHTESRSGIKRRNLAFFAPRPFLKQDGQGNRVKEK